MNPLKGEVTFKSGEDEYRLVFSIDALIGLEERFNRNVQEIGEMMGDALRLTDLRALFHAGLREYHPDVSEQAAGRVMSEIGVTEVGRLISRAFGAAFDSGEEVAADGARRPQGRAGGGRRASTSGSSSSAEASETLAA